MHTVAQTNMQPRIRGFTPSTALRGFTIVELLVVVTVLGVLAAIVINAVNPAEIMAQARDSIRMSDLKSAKETLDIFVIDSPNVSLGSAQTVYISIPDTSATCSNISGLPTLPAGWSYKCSTTANLRNINGTGWIPLDFTSIKTGSPLRSLPIDPQNSSTTGRYYTYVANGSYEVASLMEANKNFASVKDGGKYVEMYEVGTDLSLLPVSRDPSLISYWALDGTGTITDGQTTGLLDLSGRGNNGIASNVNGSGMSFAAGKVGNGVQFDGVDDSITIPTMSFGNTNWTTTVWAKSTSASRSLLSNASGGPVANLMGTGSSKIMYQHYDSIWKYEYGLSNVTDGNWHYLTWANRSDRTMDLYVDGVREASIVPSAIGNTGPINKLGGAWGPSFAWLGVIDDVRVYNRTLSSNEIKAIYDATK